MLTIPMKIFKIEKLESYSSPKAQTQDQQSRSLSSPAKVWSCDCRKLAGVGAAPCYVHEIRKLKILFVFYWKNSKVMIYELIAEMKVKVKVLPMVMQEAKQKSWSVEKKHLVGSNSGKVCESLSPRGRLECDDTWTNFFQRPFFFGGGR